MGATILAEAARLAPVWDVGMRFRKPGAEHEHAIIVIPSLNPNPEPDLEGFTGYWQNSHGMQRATITPRMTRTAAE